MRHPRSTKQMQSCEVHVGRVLSTDAQMIYCPAETEVLQAIRTEGPYALLDRYG